MNFFDTLIGMFVEPSQKVAKSLAEHVGSFFHAQLILNTIITILFMIWAYKRVKEGDMFEFKRNYQSNALFKSNNGNAKRDYGRWLF